MKWKCSRLAQGESRYVYINLLDTAGRTIFYVQSSLKSKLYFCNRLNGFIVVWVPLITGIIGKTEQSDLLFDFTFVLLRQSWSNTVTLILIVLVSRTRFVGLYMFHELVLYIYKFMWRVSRIYLTAYSAIRRIYSVKEVSRVLWW